MKNGQINPYLRLLSHVDMQDGHWFWKGGTTGQHNEYGKFWYKGKSISAHSVRLILETGEDRGEGWDSAHTCEFKLCVRHTIWLTRKENAIDRTSRIKKCSRGHALNVSENYYTNSQGHRKCKACAHYYWSKKYSKTHPDWVDKSPY